MATLDEQLADLEARARASLEASDVTPPGGYTDAPVKMTVQAQPQMPAMSDTGDVSGFEDQPGEPQPVDPNAMPPRPNEPAPYGEEKDLDTQLAELEAKTKDTLDPEYTPQVGALQQYARFFNRDFAFALGIVPEAANEILSFIGLGMWDPYRGEAPKFIADRMRAMGIDTAEAQEKARSFAEKFGDKTFFGLAQAAGMVAAAPALAARQGVSIIGELAKSIAKNPKLAILTEVPATAGAVYGEEKGGLTGAIAGGMAGGMAATGVAAGVSKIGRGVNNLLIEPAKGIGNAVMDAVSGTKRPGAGTPQPKTPLYDEFFDRGITKVFAEQQVEGEKLRMATALQNAVRSIPTKGTPEQVQAATRALMEKAEKAAARIEGEFWQAVPLKATVPMTPVRQGIASMEAEFADMPSKFPRELAEKFKELTIPKRDPDTGRMIKAQPTVQRVRDMIGEIRLARKREEGLEKQGITPNYGLIRGYHMLESIGHDAIERALPGDVSIQQARRISTIYNDLFSRGGIADVMARRSRGDMSVPPGETVETLMKKFGGVQELLDVRNKLAYVRAPGGRSFALGKQERADVQAMVKEAEDSVRSMFREFADADPVKGAKWFAKHEKDIRPMAKVHAELNDATNQINAVIEQEKIFKTSALARFAQADADKAINTIWLHKDPVGQSKELMKTFKGDADALEGLQQGLLNKFFSLTKGNPMKALEVLKTPRYQDMLSTVLDPDQMARLTKITDITSRIARGDEKLLRHAMLPTASIAARIMGAQAGRQISHIMGGGTLQAASIMSETFKRGAEKALRTMAPQQMLINAIVDPKWERLLYSRSPVTTKDARKLIRTMRRVVGASEGMRQDAIAKLSGDDDDNR